MKSNCYPKSTFRYKGIRIVEIYYFGEVLYLYRKPDRDYINVSISYASVKKEINRYFRSTIVYA